MKKKLLAVLFAAIMVMTMIPATAFAENLDTTTVKLTVAAKNVYTMTIPATTTMNADGAATALVNGLNVKGSNMNKSVVVTMEGADEWKLSATGSATTIGYAVYDTNVCETAITTVTFTKEEVEADNGTTKNLWVKPDADDLEKADAGEYTGTITFTAALKADAADALVIGAEYELKVNATNNEEQNYNDSFTCRRTESGFEVVKVIRNSEDFTDKISANCSSTVEDSVITFEVQNVMTITVNTANNTYTLTKGDYALSDTTFTSFSVKPAGASEFTEITLSLADQ